MAVTATKRDGSVDYNVAEVGDLYNDNLLINSDFRSGVINQKGETSYSYTGTGGKLTVDMWISYGVNVGIETNTIRIVNRDTTEHTLRQKMSKAYPNQVYTVAIQVGSMIGDVYINFNNETATNKKLKVGLNVFQITPVSTFGEFCFLLKANAEIKFNYAKVEPGSFFTGMPIWNNSEELTKCMTYFRILDLTFSGGLSNGTAFPRQRTVFENIMRKIPSVKYVSTQTLYNCTATIEYVDRFGITLKSTPTDKNDDWIIEGYRVELDAYDY